MNFKNKIITKTTSKDEVKTTSKDEVKTTSRDEVKTTLRKKVNKTSINKENTILKEKIKTTEKRVNKTSKNKETIKIKSFKIRIKDKKTYKIIHKHLFDHFHLKNIYTLILEKYSPKDENWENWNILSDPIIMKAVFSQTYGQEKTRERIEKMNKLLKDEQLFESFIEMNEKINDKNASMIFRNVKGSWKTFFSNVKNFKKGKIPDMPSPPKAQKLSKITKNSISIESDKWSLKKKDKLGLTLGKKRIYFNFKHKGIIERIGIKNIKGIKILLNNDEIFIQFSYIDSLEILEIKAGKSENKSKEIEIKTSGIDVGINNLLSLFINDKENESIIVDGKMYKKRNVSFNRLKAKLDESISKEIIEYYDKQTKEKVNIKDLKSLKKELREKKEKHDFIPITWSEKGLKRLKFKKFIIYKRNEFFENEFNKISKKVAQYLSNTNVTDLIISKNLSFAKKEGNIKLRKGQKQTFYNIPFGKLLNSIEEKCQNKGIKVHDIDESYTSKSSSLNGDVKEAQKLREEFFESKEIDKNKKELNKQLTKVLNGKRVKRGLFKDTISNIIFNADINGAINHIKIKFDINVDYLYKNLFKICNPIKLKSTTDFDIFLLNMDVNKRAI